ncbi:MAG: molybdopterin-guanine dinucleotide biosynthesis protein B [Coriobacteriia bacterium]|nr:molybdopterin-guanine dinucleotide biosynthesis protein B [Coriobacteriia bacterium]MBS5477795.1 molybdopterin-guanine dinucleotide biosynthesis protein B [Coriobacteriia bacterium]
MYTLFLTGGIGSGKSVAAAHLAGRGARVIDLDEVAHRVLEEADVKAALAQRFGEDVLRWPLFDDDCGFLCGADPLVEQAEVDRAELARRAFADESSTRDLDAITHPRILARLGDMLVGPGCCAKAGEDFALTVVEVPLIEGAGRELADEVMTLSCPLELRRQRAVERGMDADDFDRRAERQISDERRAELADTIIANDGTPEQLAAALDAWWDERAAGGWRSPATADAASGASVPPAPPAVSEAPTSSCPLVPVVQPAGLASPVIAFVGRHNSGKTTLVEKVIAGLVARGHDVGSVKHHGHRGFSIDVEGKDSWRHRQAGASEVVVASPDQLALMRSLTQEQPMEEVVALMEPHDVVVVEGYRHSTIPCVEVMRAANERDVACARAFVAAAGAGEPFAFSPEHEHDLGKDADRLPNENTVGIATDMPDVKRACALAGLRAFDVNDAQAVVAFIERDVIGAGPRADV